MSDSKEKEEGGQNAPLAVHKTQQSVDAQVQPEALAAPQPIEEKTNDVENRKVEAEAPAGDKTGKVEVEAPMEEQNGKVEVEAASEDKNVKVEGEAPVEDKNGKVQVEASSEDKNEEALVEAPMVDKNVKPEANSEGVPRQDVENSENSTLHSVLVEDNAQALKKTEYECVLDVKSEAEEVPQSDKVIENDASVCQNNVDTAETAVQMKPESCEAADSRACNDGDSVPLIQNEPITPSDRNVEIKNGLEIENKDNETQAAVVPANNGNSISKNFCFLDADHSYDGNESGTDEEQSAFMKVLENFFRERSMEFKAPKFYGEGLNCLKLWRAVIRLGGYDKVTTCKLWRQVGESFKPPKTCTTVSWTFRGFYEKALLDYERHKTQSGELNVPIASHSEPMHIDNQSLLPDKCVQASASGRARRDAAAKAMQGWHSQRLLGNGEVSDPVIKDRNSLSMQKREKQLKSINLLKRKKPSYMDNTVKAARSKPSRPQLDTSVIDIGPPADWVKINVQKTKDCFEVYALVPGLLREEVRVQSDPAGRLVISGEPEHPDNPWGVTPFKKVVSLPSRIDPHQTSAVVTLHGQLFVRVPFEQSE